MFRVFVQGTYRKPTLDAAPMPVPAAAVVPASASAPKSEKEEKEAKLRKELSDDAPK